MAEVKTQAQKFKEIADVIRVAEGITVTSEINNQVEEVFYGTFSANDFASEIKKLSLNMVAPVNSFENGYYGIRAAKCASTYLWARVNGDDKFAYRTNSIFSKVNSNGQNYVRDADYGRIDCSTFVSLCLRGIPYNKSPYPLHKGSNEKWTPSTELPSMYGTEGWEFREIDAQPEGVFNDIGISGKSSVRLAAALGQYFHKYGYVLYDSALDGKIESGGKYQNHTELNLQPGDLVFWDTKEDAQVDSRFKGISHVAIVSERPDYYYHVTGSSDKFDQLVVWYEQFAETDTAHPNSAMVLAVRPDYRHGNPKENTPTGVNLLGFPWVYSRLLSAEKNGLTISLVDPNTIKLNGTATENTTLSLAYITLSPGKYELTGIEGFTGTSFALQVRYADGTDFETPVRYPTGTDATNEFVLTEETEVNVRLYISNDKILTGATVVPTLVCHTNAYYVLTAEERDEIVATVIDELPDASEVYY